MIKMQNGCAFTWKQVYDFLDIITSSNPLRFGQKTSFDDVRFCTYYKRGKERQKTNILHPKLKPFTILW